MSFYTSLFNSSIPNLQIVSSNNFTYNTDYKLCLNLANDQDKKILLIFSADWCGYCGKLKSNLNTIEQSNKFIICIIDTDINKNFAKKFNIKSLPTSLIISKDEKILSSKIGYNKKDYEQWINKHY